MQSERVKIFFSTLGKKAVDPLDLIFWSFLLFSFRTHKTTIFLLHAQRSNGKKGTRNLPLINHRGLPKEEIKCAIFGEKTET